MKILSLLALMTLLASCSTSAPRQEDPLYAYMTKEEISFYENRSLSNDRSPSSESRKLIEKNAWLFESKENRFLLYKSLEALRKSRREIAKLSKKVNDLGVGAQGEVLFGFGGKWLAELVIHENTLGLFCAPGVSAATDAGLSASIFGLRTLSCHTNDNYKGGFLSIAAGVSGEYVGLPIGVGVGYSLGVDFSKLKEGLHRVTRAKEFNEEEVREELKTLQEVSTHLPLKEKTALNFAVKILSFTGTVESGDSFGHSGFKYVKRSIKEKKSISSDFQKMMESKEFLSFLDSHHLGHLKAVFKVLAESLTGCDAVGGSASLSLTLSPVSGGVSYTHYRLVEELPLNLLKETDFVTPVKLLDPGLLENREVPKLLELARTLIKLPQKVRAACGPGKLIGP